MNSSVKLVVKILILLAYLTIIFILEIHYVAIGEYSAMVYYYPLGRWDYILIPLVGIILLSLSLRFIQTSLKMRVIEASVYTLIISVVLIFGNEILSSRTENRPDYYRVTTVKDEPSKNILSGYIENTDSIYIIIEGLISERLNLEKYSYKVWATKTKELFGVETCEHFNDYDYLIHEINILEYLNWHLLKKISKRIDVKLMNELRLDIAMADTLLYSQYDFLDAYFTNQSTRYEHCGICKEQKTIINENLQDFYDVLTRVSSNFKPRKITQMNDYPYDCPDIDEKIIEEEYRRFISECILTYDDEPRSSAEIELITTRLTDEYKAWMYFIDHRDKVEEQLTGHLKRVWAYGTKVWKLNRIRQLKNEFECYGTMSELDYSLSLQDCNYTELMNYHSLSSAWEDYMKSQK